MSFFTDRTYTSKADIIQAIIDYNDEVKHPYRVVKSNECAYKATCIHDDCDFVVQFAFSSNFKPPTKFTAHSCATDINLQGTAHSFNRKWTGKQLAQSEAVQRFYDDSTGQVTPIMLKKFIERTGATVSYQNCVDTIATLKSHFIKDTESQYASLPMYVKRLQEHEHFALLRPRMVNSNASA